MRFFSTRSTHQQQNTGQSLLLYSVFCCLSEQCPYKE
nr:MAG TPA: hypothetical protein [Caudoviricetes sp.]